jgi:hypothetical protein
MDPPVLLRKPGSALVAKPSQSCWVRSPQKSSPSKRVALRNAILPQRLVDKMGTETISSRIEVASGEPGRPRSQMGSEGDSQALILCKVRMRIEAVHVMHI